MPLERHEQARRGFHFHVGESEWRLLPTSSASLIPLLHLFPDPTLHTLDPSYPDLKYTSSIDPLAQGPSSSSMTLNRGWCAYLSASLHHAESHKVPICGSRFKRSKPNDLFLYRQIALVWLAASFSIDSKLTKVGGCFCRLTRRRYSACLEL